MDNEVEVPPYFLCPISLEIMKDPVTMTTGITYDRESIEKWIFSGENKCCPVTKQNLTQNMDMTPNITLRRLIQAWCTLNSSYGIERFPTPKPPASKLQIVKLINEAKKAPQKELECIRSLRSVASQSETNKRCIESAGGVEFLVSMINNAKDREDLKPCEEALGLLYTLKLSQNGLRFLSGGGNNEFFGSLISIMQRGSYESRAYSVMLLKPMFEVVDHSQMAGLRIKFFVELVQILKDQISNKASKATLNLLVDVCPWGRNRIRAVEAGLVSVLIDLVLDSNVSSEKGACEMMFVLLEQLCKCAEGRAELLKHGAGLAMVSKKILRVSHIVSEMAMKILYSIAQFSATKGVVQEMLNVGVVKKLCLVLQVDCGVRMKEKAREILKLHTRAWKNSPCIPLEFYP